MLFTKNLNKLTCLSLARLFSLTDCLWARPEPYPRKLLTFSKLKPYLQTIYLNKLECLSLTSLYSLVQCLGKNYLLIAETVNYGRKKFYDSGPMLCRLARDKHSSLLRQFVNKDIKSFITLGPDVNPIKVYYSVIYKCQ